MRRLSVAPRPARALALLVPLRTTNNSSHSSSRAWEHPRTCHLPCNSNSSSSNSSSSNSSSSLPLTGSLLLVCKPMGMATIKLHTFIPTKHMLLRLRPLVWVGINSGTEAEVPWEGMETLEHVEGGRVCMGWINSRPRQPRRLRCIMEGQWTTGQVLERVRHSTNKISLLVGEE